MRRETTENRNKTETIYVWRWHSPIGEERCGATVDANLMWAQLSTSFADRLAWHSLRFSVCLVVREGAAGVVPPTPLQRVAWQSKKHRFGTATGIPRDAAWKSVIVVPF